MIEQINSPKPLSHNNQFGCHFCFFPWNSLSWHLFDPNATAWKLYKKVPQPAASFVNQLFKIKFSRIFHGYLVVFHCLMLIRPINKIICHASPLQLKFLTFNKIVNGMEKLPSIHEIQFLYWLLAVLLQPGGFSSFPPIWQINGLWVPRCHAPTTSDKIYLGVWLLNCDLTCSATLRKMQLQKRLDLPLIIESLLPKV